MARPKTSEGGSVLVDTNVIIEASRVSAWKALTGCYDVETVEMCVIETQTGLQRRRKEQQIDYAALTKSLKAVHPVSKAERAAALLKTSRCGSWTPASRCCGPTP